MTIQRLVLRGRDALAPGASGAQLLVLLLAQALSAGLLYLTLFPPAQPRLPITLNVLTADARPVNAAGPMIALPEAPEHAQAERVPDLASALRQHPEVNALRVLGAGLTARDLDAARTLPLRFEPAPLPRGVVELALPAQLRVGNAWQLSGRVNAVLDGSVELLDPAGAVQAKAALDPQGSFRLAGQARVAGLASYRLRVLDAGQQELENLEIPLLILAAEPLRVLVLAGGINAELKYLRRWALDSGVQLRSQLSLGGGMQLSEQATVRAQPVAALSPESLQQLDLLVLDERSWRALGAGRRAMVIAAARAGLGVLLRITGALSDAERTELRALGFAVQTSALLQTIKLDGAATELSRRPLQVQGAGLVPLLSSATGEPLAAWGALGEGRFALWWLDDSFQLVLREEPLKHGKIWSQAFQTLARARATRLPELRSALPRVHERLVFCRLQDGAVIEATSRAETRLLRDADACAAYWPASSGWHTLVQLSLRLPFYVRSSEELPGLAAQQLRNATAQLAANASETQRADPGSVPGPAWPWFTSWLLVSGLLWWLERRVLKAVHP